jgi:hypothetical protein
MEDILSKKWPTREDARVLIKLVVLDRACRDLSLIPAIDRAFGEQFRNYLGLESVAETRARLADTVTESVRSSYDKPIEFFCDALCGAMWDCGNYDYDLIQYIVLCERERHLPLITKRFEELYGFPLLSCIWAVFSNHNSYAGEALCAHIKACASMKNEPNVDDKS